MWESYPDFPSAFPNITWQFRELTSVVPCDWSLNRKWKNCLAEQRDLKDNNIFVYTFENIIYFQNWIDFSQNMYINHESWFCISLGSPLCHLAIIMVLTHTTFKPGPLTPTSKSALSFVWSFQYVHIKIVVIANSWKSIVCLSIDETNPMCSS